MSERLLNLQKIYVSGQKICIEVYGNSVGTLTPEALLPAYSESKYGGVGLQYSYRKKEPSNVNDGASKDQYIK